MVAMLFLFPLENKAVFYFCITKLLRLADADLHVSLPLISVPACYVTEDFPVLL